MLIYSVGKANSQVLTDRQVVAQLMLAHKQNCIQ